MSICEGLFTTLGYVLDYVEHQYSALPPPPPPPEKNKTKTKQNKKTACDLFCVIMYSITLIFLCLVLYTVVSFHRSLNYI